MQQLEQKLDELLVKKAPFQIPENGRKALVNALPWLTVIGGALMLWAAWTLWQVAHWVDGLAGVANSLSVAYGTGYVTPVAMSPLLWVSLIILIIEALMFFVAFPALKAHQKKGWNILFWVSLVNAVQGVVQAIAYSGIGSIISQLLGTLIGLYLLFQVRSYYTGAATAKASTSPTMNVPKETPPATPQKKM